MSQIAVRTFHDIRAALLARRELALLDVREEDPFAQAHPLFAANLPLSRLELEIHARVPRRDTPITVYDDGEGLAPVAAQRLLDLGYSDVALLDGGLSGWRNAGGELFRDVNVPSKAFGELVEAERHTPSLAAEEVQTLLDARADAVILDARRFDEYQTMSIPGGISVPGAELVLRVAELAPDPRTRVIVNCAGRTRSIIGTQSLLNAGIPNPVAALRNGTIGWTLAGQQLEHGQTRRFGAISQDIARPPPSAPVPSPTAPASNASTWPVWPNGRTSTTAPPTCSTYARPRNTKPVTCLAPAPRPVASWFRKPTMSPACAARAWYWWTTMAYAPT